MDKFELTPEEQAKYEEDRAYLQKVQESVFLHNRIQATCKSIDALPMYKRTESVRNALWVLPHNPLDNIAEEKIPRIRMALDYLGDVLKQHA